MPAQNGYSDSQKAALTSAAATSGSKGMGPAPKSYPYMDTLNPAPAATNLSQAGRGLVSPEGRTANVSADAPKIDTTSSPISGDVHFVYGERQ